MAGLGFEETELRLGLPGGGNEAEEAVRSSGKRGYAETIDLMLKLEPASAAAPPSEDDEEVADGAAEAQPSPAAADGQLKRSPSQSSVVTAQPEEDPEKPRAPKYVLVAPR